MKKNVKVEKVRSATQVNHVGGNLNSSEPETVLSGVGIKLCSNCNSTYTDEALSYCLRDGTLLKLVGKMPAVQQTGERR